jgi:membrane protein implicated in regulation of membrane protease activity
MMVMLLVYSYLLVFITGGSIEAHFHFFIILSLLLIYYDWRLIWIGVVLVALHHGVLDLFNPTWVFHYGRNDISVLAHALGIIVLAVFLTKLAEHGREEVEQLRKTNEKLGEKIRA